MKIVLQRVSYGSVKVDNTIVGEISKGFVILFGVGQEDTEKNADFLADKCLNLRIFEDEQGKMNLSINDIKGEILVVSQFTLYGDTKKGRRPSFVNAGSPEKAEELYNYFVKKLRESKLKVETGIFRADMKVEIHNSGPVTFILDTKDY
ncbi:MAG: D-aminoacyl-tRNA deacylase [Candidatus Sericytochromatia bacterium]